MNELLKSSFDLATIYIGIVKGFFCDIYKNQPISKNELYSINTYESKYIEHWLNCAYSSEFILFTDDKKITLTEKGKKYVLGLGNDIEIVEVLRAIYSIIIINKSFEIFDSKKEPNYSIIFESEFTNLIPFYKLISQETHVNIAKNEIINNPEIALLFSNSKVIDYGCGSGWFIDLLQLEYPNNHYIGIDDEQMILKATKELKYDLVSDSQEIPFFDILFLNRVLHHLGEKRLLILESIIKKMNKDACIVIWEFNWRQDESLNSIEMAFLNLIEHIQGNTFLELKNIQNELAHFGLHTHHFFINDYKDFVVIAKK